MRVLALALVAGLLAAFAPPPGPQLSYQGSTYGFRLERSGTRFLETHDHGFLPRFSIGSRELAQPPSDEEIAPRLLAGAATPGSALVLAIARLDLPAVSGGSWFLRHRAQGRRAALDLDLLSDRNTAAARTCLLVEVGPLPGATSDHCSIRAVLDEQGWPIVAEVRRTLRGPARTKAMASVALARIR